MANFNLPAVPTTPEGGLAGFFRGTQYNYGLADLDRQFRDSDLLNQIKQNEYENALKDNPNKEANRVTDLLKQSEEQDQYRSGLKRDSVVTDLNNKKLEGRSRQLLIRKEEITQASDFLTRLQQEMLVNDLSIIGNWEAIKKEMQLELAKKHKGLTNISETTDVFGDENTVTEIGRTIRKDASGKVKSTGKYVSIWKKVDGKFIVVREMWNDDSK